jgi:hypothetical protein
MSCPLNANRWRGSGYCKESNKSDGNKEMDARLADLLAARQSQDHKFAPCQTKPDIESKGKIDIHITNQTNR